jgi:hypothetical protein
MTEKDLGVVTAYAYAVEGGYTGTEAEFTALLGDLADTIAELEGLTVTVNTLPAGSSATASYADGVLSLGIPKGDKGDQGDIGPTPDMEIGTVTTLPAGSDATASITGTPENPVLNLGIPKGDKGDTGEVTQAEFDDLKSAMYDIYPTDTASGAIANFPDGADNIPVKSLTIAIEPVQSGSGDPSPDNVRPISGWTEAKVTRTGENLFDKTTAQAGYIDNSDGQQKGQTASLNYKCTDYVPVFGGMSVYVNTEQTAAVWGAWYDISKSFISGVTGYANKVITAPTNAKYLRLTIEKSDDGNIDTFAVNHPSTDHAYHAYSGETITIDLDGTVYGGTLDVTEGELTVDRAMVDLGALNWLIASTDATVQFFYATLSGKANGTENLLSDRYKTKYRGQWTPDIDYVISGDTNTSQLYIKDSRYTSASDFKAAMNGVQLCYELATPIEISLTAQQLTTLLGQNNIWSDSGDVTVDYRADTGLYIDKLTGSTEDDMIADAPIASGQYFFVGNTLYLSTAAIAAGATLTPGTNCVQTTLAEALNNLNS